MVETNLVIIPIIFVFYVSLPRMIPNYELTKAFQFPKQEKLTVLPTVKMTGEIVHRCNVDFEYFEATFFFLEDEKYIIKNIPVAFNISVQCPAFVFTAVSPAYCEKVNVYYVKNASIRPPSTIILPNGDLFFLFRGAAPYVTPPSRRQGVMTPEFGYKYLLYVSGFWGGSFGHIFTDIMGGLIFLPEWIWSLDPVFITHFSRDITSLLFSVIGHPNTTIINVNADNYYYAENLFAVTGIEHWHTFGLHTYYILKKKYRKYLGLTDIKPTKYHYTNKKPGRRYFVNLNEAMQIACSVTKLDWTPITVEYQNTKEYARQYAECRILVIPCGSIAFNTICMEDGTGIITLNSNQLDMPQAFFCQCIRIWNIFIVHEDLRHDGKSGYVKKDELIDNIKRMLYTIEHQKFPYNDLFDASALNEAKQTFYEFGENNVILYKDVLGPKYKKYREKMLHKV